VSLTNLGRALSRLMFALISRSIDFHNHLFEPRWFLVENIDEHECSDWYGNNYIDQCHGYQIDKNLCGRFHNAALLLGKFKPDL
jgi:hypothetical protein